MQTAPNILLICTDQQRWDTLGCYGNFNARTPVLDNLAKEGTLFERCYVQSPVCSPSRASLFTGKYPRNHGLWMNGVSLPDHEIFFSKVLADMGYDCGMVGKHHQSGCDGVLAEKRFDDGFRVFEWSHAPSHATPHNAYRNWLKDEYPKIYDDVVRAENDPDYIATANRAKGATPVDTVPVEAHYSHWVAERSIDFITNTSRDADQPFFMMANFFDPHHPFGAPDAFRSFFDADQLPPPHIKPGELDTKPKMQKIYSEKSYGGAAPGFLDYTEAEVRETRAAYAAMVAMIDYEVGRILAALDQAGMTDNTLVIFTSDHGELIGDHGLMLKGPMMYEASVRVPLIVRWPGHIPSGVRRDELVQWIDLPATLLDAAQADGLHNGQGQSLMPLFSDTPAPSRDWAICEYREDAQNGIAEVSTTMLVHGKHKLVVWLGALEKDAPMEGELYDLDADPHEQDNLFANPDYRNVREQMKDKLLHVIIATEDRSQPRLTVW